MSCAYQNAELTTINMSNTFSWQDVTDGRWFRSEMSINTKTPKYLLSHILLEKYWGIDWRTQIRIRRYCGRGWASRESRGVRRDLRGLSERSECWGPPVASQEEAEGDELWVINIFIARIFNSCSPKNLGKHMHSLSLWSDYIGLAWRELHVPLDCR